MPFRRPCVDARLILCASRAFLVAPWQLDSHSLSAIAAFIVASLQLAYAEFLLRDSHSYSISAFPAYGFSRFIIGPLGDRRINQPTNAARHLKHPKHNGWYSRCLCT